MTVSFEEYTFIIKMCLDFLTRIISMYEQGLRNDRDPVHPVEINTTTFFRL